VVVPVHNLDFRSNSVHGYGFDEADRDFRDRRAIKKLPLLAIPSEQTCTASFGAYVEE
jgi:hypothetical protein